MSDDTGYELDDPKHPTYYERYADHADQQRKAAREQAYRNLRNSEVPHDRAEQVADEAFPFEGPEPDGSRYLGNGLWGATDR